MGIVYKAKDPILNRTVAIKVMSEGLAHDVALRERFLREAQAAGSLQHPNVVTIYDFGETDGHLFIAMEFIQGADLEHLMKHNAPISLAAKLDIMIDVLNGLSYAHRRGIVHRDIKPANIRIDDEGHARIMDFGVARLSTSNLTSTGVMMGTPNYMAPEQISGEAVTPSVDLFSAGAVLYELLTNTKPFAGDTLHSVLFKIVSDTPPELTSLQPGLPASLNAVVKKALEKDPEQRYKSATEMANALSAVRAPLGVARASKTVSQRVSIDKGLQAQRDAQKRTAVRRRWRNVGGVAAAVLVLVALGSFALRRGRPLPAASAPTVGTPAVATLTDTVRPQPSPPPVNASATPAPVIANPQPSNQQVAVRPDPAARRSATTTPPRAAAAAATKGATVDSPRASPAVIQAAPPPTPQRESVVTAPVVTPPVAPPAVTVAPKSPVSETESPATAIGTIVAAYGRAIGTRDVAEVRRVYAGMTPQQQSQWQSFFTSVRSMTATFQVASLDVSGSSAVARLTGLYEYVTRAGRSERQPVAFEATLRRDGERWTLQSVR